MSFAFNLPSGLKQMMQLFVSGQCLFFAGSNEVDSLFFQLNEVNGCEQDNVVRQIVIILNSRPPFRLQIIMYIGTKHRNTYVRCYVIVGSLSRCGDTLEMRR